MSSHFISKEEIKTEIRAAVKEVAVEWVSKFFDGFLEDKFAESKKTAENEPEPLIIAGIAVPSKYWNLKITELIYSNSQMAERISTILSYQDIIYIKDFRRRDIELEKIRYFGKITFKEFKLALIKTVWDDYIAYVK